MSARDRRGGAMDPESLERENERNLDSLSERIGLLKQATHGIRSEVESQHHVLDRMTDAMFSTGGMLGGAADKFRVVRDATPAAAAAPGRGSGGPGQRARRPPAPLRCAAQVMNNKQNKQMLTLVGGFAAVLLLLYWLLFD
ncbi:BET11 [Scenedesmus sp. PABB004]|nr:BET11 [Scenedesmus sp. PABB004]